MNIIFKVIVPFNFYSDIILSIGVIFVTSISLMYFVE